MKRVSHTRGFTLAELMVVVAIAGVLAAIAGNELSQQIMRAKRTEAVMGLNFLWKAQKTYFAEKNQYTSNFDSLAFDISGGRQLSATAYKGGRYTYQLSQPWGQDSFYCVATADLDGDAWPDILEIFEK